jgi:Skp family chaperone for outer membrane proteins
VKKHGAIMSDIVSVLQRVDAIHGLNIAIDLDQTPDGGTLPSRFPANTQIEGTRVFDLTGEVMTQLNANAPSSFTTSNVPTTSTYTLTSQNTVFVDLTKIFGSYQRTKVFQAKLKANQETDQTDLNGLIADSTEMEKEAQRLLDASKDPTLSDTARQNNALAMQQKNPDLIALQNKITEARTEKSTELKDESLRMHKELVTDIANAIKNYNSAHGIAFVFSIDTDPKLDFTDWSALLGLNLQAISPATAQANSNVPDITNDIIAQLNASPSSQ